MADTDKRVEEARAKNAAIYNSQSHPEHFENEGGEQFESDETIDKNIDVKDRTGLSSAGRKAVPKEKKIKHGNGLSTGEGEEAGDFIGSSKIREKDKK